MYVKVIPRELIVTMVEGPPNLVDGFSYMVVNDKVRCKYKMSWEENEQVNK